MVEESWGVHTRALYTGDLGYRDSEGYLYFVGRKDQQMKSMGVRVSPGEVEGILMASGQLRGVAVFGLPDSLLGDEIWAAVVPDQPPAEFSRRHLEKFGKRNMSRYMLPRRYLVLDKLPLTSTGKIDYIGLKARAKAVRQKP
jgi:acyl-CoA synthetase (AMP-forming)/AMP-acid ligase II